MIMEALSQFIEMFEEHNFNEVELKNLIDKTFPGEWGKEDIDGSGTKVIRTTNFTNEGSLNLTDVVTRNIETKKVEKKKLLKGDIILERSGGTQDNPVGRVVCFDADGLFVTNNFTQTLRCSSDINSLYLFYFLFIFYKRNKMIIRGMGSQTTGIQNLSMSQYQDLKIIVPPIEHQLKFASIAQQADKSKFELRKSIDAIDSVIKSLINNQ